MFDKIFFQNNKPTTSAHRNPYSVNFSVISKKLYASKTIQDTVNKEQIHIV